MPMLRWMETSDLTDAQWERLRPLLPPQKPPTGRPAKDHRTVVNGILWVLRTGCPWRCLPERYGSWKTVSSRFYRWQKVGGLGPRPGRTPAPGGRGRPARLVPALHGQHGGSG